MVSIDQIKQLRQETAVSMSECKNALDESGGDIEKAKEILRKKGKDLANKKSSRDASQGIVEVYLHSNKKVGVMLELCCESDFVAKSDDFHKLAHEVCLQIAAMKPLVPREEDISEKVLTKEKEIYQDQLKESDKPQEVVDKIIEGKLNKYKKEVSLLSQSWVKDEKKTIKDLVEEYIGKIGENIIVKRFIRYEL